MTATGPSPSPEPALDLRTRRKLRTRQALQWAALQLFAEYGYEATTVAEIAALAEVGERTFFFHFPTKEDVLFDGSHEGFGDFEQFILSAPPHLPDLGVIEHALLRRFEKPDPVISHQMTQWLVRASETSSVVRGKRMEYANGIAAAAANALGHRRREQPPTLATITLAEIAMRTFYLAVGEWAQAGPNDMIPIIRRRFRALRAVANDPKRM